MVGPYNYTFQGIAKHDGPNYTAIVGKFSAKNETAKIISLRAEKRRYNSGMNTTEAAIHSTFTGDLYAVIGDADGPDGAYITRLYFNPLVSWMWMGALVMMIGGGVSLLDRRHRIGLPSPKINA